MPVIKYRNPPNVYRLGDSALIDTAPTQVPTVNVPTVNPNTTQQGAQVIAAAMTGQSIIANQNWGTNVRFVPGRGRGRIGSARYGSQGQPPTRTVQAPYNQTTTLNRFAQNGGTSDVNFHENRQPRAAAALYGLRLGQNEMVAGAPGFGDVIASDIGAATGGATNFILAVTGQTGKIAQSQAAAQTAAVQGQEILAQGQNTTTMLMLLIGGGLAMMLAWNAIQSKKAKSAA